MIPKIYVKACNHRALGQLDDLRAIASPLDKAEGPYRRSPKFAIRDAERIANAWPHPPTPEAVKLLQWIWRTVNQRESVARAHGWRPWGRTTPNR